MKSIPSLSNSNVDSNRDIENNKILLFVKLLLRINGRVKMKSAIGITKNWIPPHALIPKVRIIPAKISRRYVELDFLFFIPLKKRYNPIIPNNKPKGSDLNHPKEPLNIIGVATENNSEDINPAPLPPITLTNKKMGIVVSEPIITGKIIVKS